MSKPLLIDYYTDILCVWAWIAQKRIDELNKELGNKIEFQYKYLDIFGDTQSKMEKQWSSKGSFSGFAKHVVESAAPYSDAFINPDIWKIVKPTTSANVHLVLKAIEIAFGKSKSIDMALEFRKSFFIDAQDISDLNVLYNIVEKNDLAVRHVKEVIENGKALAALMSDYQSAKALSLKGSPTYIIDNGRQTLYGNVGYRVLLANIEEQIKQPVNEASWC